MMHFNFFSVFLIPTPGRPVCLVYIFISSIVSSIILVIVYDYSYTIHGI